MSTHANSQPWWRRTNKETLADRVKAVQNVNDPTIMADDVQRWSKIVLLALLGFTTLLSAASYLKFFEKAFGFHLALIMALTLACVIEFGKNWGFLRVLRIPFFQGWSYVWAEVANTVMWVFLLLLSLVTFSASVYNSTQGAKQLSLLLSHERTYSAFSPNTAEIDAQITKLQVEDDKLGDIKRKNGKTNWAIQPMKAENSKTLASLQEQRRVIIEKQRADWESQDAIRTQQNAFSANSLLAVGGWVELIQLILMFVRVAAEKSLDKTATERSATTSKPYQSTNGREAPIHNESGQRFYFTRISPTGDVQAAPTPTDALTPQPLFEDDEISVSQSPPTVTQTNVAGSVNYADDVLRLAMTRLQGFAANFDGKHRNNATVSENVNRILDETLVKMKGEGFSPSRAVYLKFYGYIITLFIAINEKGWPYERQATFEQWLLHIGSATAQPA